MFFKLSYYSTQWLLLLLDRRQVPSKCVTMKRTNQHQLKCSPSLLTVSLMSRSIQHNLCHLEEICVTACVVCQGHRPMKKGKIDENDPLCTWSSKHFDKWLSKQRLQAKLTSWQCVVMKSRWKKDGYWRDPKISYSRVHVFCSAMCVGGGGGGGGCSPEPWNFTNWGSIY